MPHVEMYSTSTCPYCQRARQLLANKQIAYREIRVDEQPELRTEMQQRSGCHTVPQIFIDGKPIGGCDDLYQLEASGQLDSLLKGKV